MSEIQEKKGLLKYGISIKQMKDKFIITKVPSMALDGVDMAAARAPNAQKLYASISRARSKIMELSYCNDWDWFVTCTFDKNKVRDRYNIDDTMSALRKWIRTRNKAGDNIKYLLVPELHADGAIHCHGLISGNIKTKPFHEYPRYSVPDKLRKSDYHNFIAMSNRFGWCSLGKVKNHEAVSYYMTKYITKNLDKECAIKESGANIYYCSQGLNRAEKIGIFHKEKCDASKMKWDWQNETTGQASKTCHSWEEVTSFIKGWEQIQ